MTRSALDRLRAAEMAGFSGTTNYYSGITEPVQYPVFVISYHHRWWGGPLLRLSRWLTDLAYFGARRQVDVVEDPIPSSKKS